MTVKVDKKELSLVRYAGDFWVTLAGYTQTRDTKGYSNQASVKSAICTFVVKHSSDKYIAFRGKAQLKTIIQENRQNPLFNAEEFQGTRTALIHYSMLELLDDRFKVAKAWVGAYKEFKQEASEFVAVQPPAEEFTMDSGEYDLLENRSALTRQLRDQINRIDRRVAVELENKERLQQALNNIESLQLVEEVL
jgi:hypothetical protein